METRRDFLRKWAGLSLSGFILSLGGILVSTSRALAKELLPAGFPKEQTIQMNPAEIDNRNLEIDPLDKFGTMGPTDIGIDPGTYRLKLTGQVEKPLSLSLDQIKQFPPTT